MILPPINSFPAAVTYVSRTTGASEEDAEKVVRAVAAFAVAQYMADQANKLPVPPAPQGVTMEQVKAYVDGRLEALSPARPVQEVRIWHGDGSGSLSDEEMARVTTQVADAITSAVGKSRKGVA